MNLEQQIEEAWEKHVKQRIIPSGTTLVLFAKENSASSVLTRQTFGKFKKGGERERDK